MHKRIYILDTTLRDGEQMPGVNLGPREKLDIARQLERLRVDVIEGGFPAASQGDYECVKAIADHIKDAQVTGLCRCVPADIERCADALRNAAAPRIHTVIATSEVHMRAKLRMTPDTVVERAAASVRLARSMCGDVEFSAEDASRSDPAFLCRVLEAVIKEGATVVSITDTVGYMLPGEMGRLIRYVMEHTEGIEKVRVSAHCHNDLGMAVANSIDAILGGVTQIECTINGLGERAGNASLEECVMALGTRASSIGAYTNIDTAQIYRTSRLVSSLSGVDIAPTKPVVGENAFKHESGIHQHGMLSDRTTYEIMTPESIGLTTSSLVLGKHSGSHAFEQRLKELGYRAAPDRLEEAFERFKALADRKKDITDRDLIALIELQSFEPTSVYELVSFQLQTGNNVTATATVKLRHNGETYTEAAVGDGSVDAIFKAIERIVGREITLEAYNIKAVTEGADALGEVTVRISMDNHTRTGKGLATDILEASAMAYLNAVNRILTL